MINLPRIRQSSQSLEIISLDIDIFLVSSQFSQTRVTASFVIHGSMIIVRAELTQDETISF